MKQSDWVWMAHPTRNNGQPLPVQIFECDGVTYYRPFDEEAAEFKVSDMDGQWTGAVSQTGLPLAEPVAWVRENELPLAPGDAFSWVETVAHKTPLYTALSSAPVQESPLDTVARLGFRVVLDGSLRQRAATMASALRKGWVNYAIEQAAADLILEMRLALVAASSPAAPS